jgi:two-component system, NarL family, nitrate/nitrite sensor histidine kinase NarX
LIKRVAMRHRYGAAMLRQVRTLVGKLAVIQTTFLVVALAAICLTLWVSWQLEGGAGAVNEAGRMRMLSYRMALDHRAGRGPELRQDMQDFEAMLARLRTGDAQRPLALPDTAECRERLRDVEQAWSPYQAALRQADVDLPLRPQADAFVARIDMLVSAVERTIAARIALLGALCFGLVVLVVAAAVVFVSGTYVWIVQPLQSLRDGLRDMASRQFNVRIKEANSVEEFSSLASGFNQMADALQASYQGLEDRVALKTAHLARQNERLAALYDVALLGHRGDVSLDTLAQEFCVKLARIAGADAAAVRLAAQDGERLLLMGQTCLPQAMIDAEHCVRKGECACGEPEAESAGPRVIPIRAMGGRSLGHCEAAGYQRVVAIPMLTGGRLVGETELFFYGEPEPDEAERQLYDALAGQFAVQVDNLRLAARDREMAVSEERNLLAQELHDSIAQVLAFLKIQVQLLRGALAKERPDDVQQSLDEIDAGVKECYGNVRELLLHFRTRPGHEDIEHALRTTLTKFEQQAGVTTQLTVQGDGVPLLPDQQIQVLHIVQEALSNVRKHARAEHVSLRVHQSPRWSFEVIDNGVGFDSAGQDLAEVHVGIQIMQERARRIGASLTLSSRPGAGTRVFLLLPEVDALRAAEGAARSPAVAYVA